MGFAVDLLGLCFTAALPLPALGPVPAFYSSKPVQPPSVDHPGSSLLSELLSE